MTTSSVRPVVLRDGVQIESPLAVVLAFVEAYGHLDVPDASPDSFGASDLRAANRGGARISAAEIATILERGRRIERALLEVAPDTSLAGPTSSLPWPALTELVEAFADIRGVGIAKMTKTLHRKRPALIPMLDSVVQRYLEDDDLGAKAPFAARALALVRGYKRDLDRNRAAVREVSNELTARGYGLTDVRILDVLIWSAGAATRTVAPV
jgi:hypothetical protein